MKTKRTRKAGPGKTIPQFAHTYREHISERQVRTAVERGELFVVEFAGLRIIPPREEARICGLLEIPLAQDCSAPAAQHQHCPDQQDQQRSGQPAPASRNENRQVIGGPSAGAENA